MDLTEAEDIKKRWQEYREELYKKDLHDPDNHNSVITHLEPEILECEVKWALGSVTTNKASGGDGIPVELFQILKDNAVKVLHSICQQMWKTQQWPQDWKRSVFIPIPKKGNAKECSNYCTIALISHANREGNGTPLQHSCLENPVDGGAWWAAVREEYLYYTGRESTRRCGKGKKSEENEELRRRSESGDASRDREETAAFGWT